MKRWKNLWQLFICMLKIGMFTFGGGYAMIHLLENEFVTKKQWLRQEEFLDLISISESTPGPIAINCSTYIGYKKEKVTGAVFATLGMVLPSFVVIYVISLFFDRFLSWTWGAAAFKGIQACVVFLILSSGVRMFKQIEKTKFNIVVASVTFLAMTACSLFAVGFSSVFYIFISGGVGLFLYALRYCKGARDKGKQEAETPQARQEEEER